MRLHRLTGLEQDKIVAEYKELLELIRDLRDILADPDKLLEVIRGELETLREDVRRRAPHRDHLESRRPHHRGPDHRPRKWW